MKPLAFNLKNARKIAGDKKSSTFELNGGHRITVAHAPLPAIQRKQLERLPVHLDKGTGGLSQDQIDAYNAADPNYTPPESSPTDVQIAGDTDTTQGLSPDQYNKLNADYNAGAPQPAPVLPENTASVQGGSIGAGDSSADTSNVQSLPNQGQPVTGSIPPNGILPSTVDLPAAYKQGQTAIREQQDVQAKQAAANVNIEQLNLDAQKKLQQGAQQNYQDFQTSQQQFLKDYQADQIKPNQYLENKNVGSKIATAIGLALGGFSSAYTKQGNPALDFLNKQIDRDIDAQRSRLDQQKTILGANQALYHDGILADNQTRINMNDIYNHQIQMQAAKLGTAKAKANADAISSQFAIQNAQLLNQNAWRSTILHNDAIASATGKPSTIDPAKLVPVSGAPEDAKKEMLKEIGNAQAAASSREALLKNFDQAAKDVRPTAGYNPLYTVVTPPSLKALGPLEDSVIHDNEGRVNEFEKKDLNALHPQTGDYDSTIATKRKAYEDFLDKKLIGPTSSAYGINLQNYASTAKPQGPSTQFRVGQIVYKNGQKAQIVDTQGNLRAVK